MKKKFIAILIVLCLVTSSLFISMADQGEDDDLPRVFQETEMND